MRTLRLALLLLLLLSLLSCRKERAPAPRTEPWENPAYGSASAAASAAPHEAGTRRRLRLDTASSRVTFSLPAKESTPRGSLRPASGELTLAGASAAASSARLTFDLLSITLEGESDGGSYGGQALDWLELGAKVGAAKREQHRFATFELLGVSEFSGSRAIARGQLSLHGFRVPVELPVDLEDRGGRFVVRSRRPLSVRLSEHDILPRDETGALRSAELPSLGLRVGREAKVDFELHFLPP